MRGAYRSLFALGVILAGLTFAVSAQEPVDQKKLREAQEYFDQGFKYQLGEGENKPDPKRALVFYHKALQIAPDLFPPLYNSALVYYGLKDYKQAQAFFIKAARAVRESEDEMAPRYEAMARNGLGSCYQQAEKLADAEKQFSIATRIYPQLVEAHYNLINLLVEEERWEEADRAILLAEKVAPSPRYEMFKGRMKGQRGRDGTQALGGKIGIAVFIALLLFYSLYLRFKRRSTAG